MALPRTIPSSAILAPNLIPSRTRRTSDSLALALALALAFAFALEVAFEVEVTVAVAVGNSNCFVKTQVSPVRV